MLFSKVFERLFYNRLYEYLNFHSLLNEAQYGFQAGKSTQDAILKFLEKIYLDLDNNLIPIGICYDLSRAFDSLNFDILIQKLKSFGIHCTDWFLSYLHNRPNYFVLKDKLGHEIKSKPYSNDVGIPQGSILGPLLFIIYINDVAKTMKNICQPVLFADYSNVATSVKEHDEIEEEVLKINNEFQSWSYENGLVMNENKTATLIFKKGIARSAKNNISATNSVRFLGIEIDEDLKFDKHVDGLCKKLRQSIYCLKVIREWADIPLLVNTYHALIQSHISYAILTWGHIPQCRYERILRLQKFALRIITRKSRRESCREVFKDLHILTFPGLYIYNVLIYAYNRIQQGSASFVQNPSNYNLRSRSNKNDLNSVNMRLKKTHDFVTFSYSKYYNALPSSIKNAKTLSNFKRKVKNYLLSMSLYTFDEYFNQNHAIE